MVANNMMKDWRWKYAFPLLSKLPTTIPWHLAEFLGRDPYAERRLTEQFLIRRFGQVFPEAAATEHRRWARAHLVMLAQEMMDASALHRLGRASGPAIDVTGWEHVEALIHRKQGFILVLNHFDRLLTSAVALALRGLSLNTLTMPIFENPGLRVAQRDFLIRKVKSFTQIAHGEWRTSTEGMRPVYSSLKTGQAWGILADAWAPEFTRMRSHPFLGGQLLLPTGIERLAETAGVPLLHAVTYSQQPDRLRVVVEVLPEKPKEAIDAVIRRLEQDVRAHPWAWWHWGQWEQMWRPAPKEETRDEY